VRARLWADSRRNCHGRRDLHGVGSLAGTAQAQLTAAYNDALSRTGFTSVAGNLDGQTLPPGLYKSTSTLGLGVGGVLYLNGAANSVFIFQVASALNMSNSSQVVLEGGVTGQANIFWQVGSSASLGTYSTFNGTILAYASITLATGSTMNGRLWQRLGRSQWIPIRWRTPARRSRP